MSDLEVGIDEARILIVDDQPFNIHSLKILLKVKLHLDPEKICSVAFNGLEAVEII